ncbi:hypothetical protein DRH13_05940 [Candidatus Woesebacteria bacterium]|nr:MAG: hypothetical protein DRH13_05940 [Candidatus Woesebacteria bacterium]
MLLTFGSFFTIWDFPCSARNAFLPKRIEKSRIAGTAILTQQFKKKSQQEGAASIHEDDVSSRQDSTLHATWARKGHQPLIPVTGARKSIKIFGSVELRSARFLNQRAKVFNSETYINYLEHLARYYYPCRVYQIQDNASYHKKRRFGHGSMRIVLGGRHIICHHTP